MQGTLPVRVAPVRKRRWSRRRYIVVGLVVLFLAASAVAAFVFLRVPGPEGPKPSPEIVKLAKDFRYRETLPNVFGPLAWSPDGAYLATSSPGTLLLRDLSSDRPRQWSVPYELTSNVMNMNIGGIEIPGAIMWSPDSRLLALDEPGGLVPRTITLVEAEQGIVRHAIRVPAPPELPARSSGSIEPVQTSGMHRLLGWADGGRSLVTILGLIPGNYPNIPGLPYPVATGAPGSASPSPYPTTVINPVPGNATSIYCYVLDVETGDLARSVQVYSSTIVPRIYSQALSPSGDALAFAWFDDPGPYSGSTTHLNLDVWDLRNSKLAYSVPNLQVNAAYSYSEGPDQFLAWSADGAALYLGSDDTVKVIEAATGRIVRTLPGTVPPTYTPVPPPTVPPTQAVVGGLPMLPMPVSTAGPGPGVPLVPLPDIFGRLFPQPAQGIPPTLTPDPNRYYPIGGIKLSPSGERLAVFDSMTMRVWDLANGKVETLTSMPGIAGTYGGPPPPGISAPVMSWSADGRLLATFARNFGGSIWLIDPETGGHLRMLSPHASNMAWSPTSNMVAMHINMGAEVWDSTGDIQPTEGPTGRPTP